MTIKFTLGIIAGIISSLAYIVYIYSILKGESKPSRVTWWVWTFMGLILAISYYFSGARNTIWSPIVEFIGPLIIALLSITYGEGGVEEKSDVICFFGGIVSIILWIVFKSPIVALVTSLFSDMFAIIPTIKKSYLRPQDENIWAWFGTGIADTTNLFAAERMSFGILVYPAYMVAVDFIVVLVLFVSKKKRKTM
ncbi:MAG: hypothetical protein WCQ32_02100 [bacterium]